MELFQILCMFIAVIGLCILGSARGTDEDRVAFWWAIAVGAAYFFSHFARTMIHGGI